MVSELRSRGPVGSSRDVGNAWSPVAQLRWEAPLTETEQIIAEARVAQLGRGSGTKRLGVVRLTDRRLTALFDGGLRGNHLTDIPRHAVLTVEDRGGHLAVRYRCAEGDEELEFGAGNRPRIFTRWWHTVAPLLRSEPDANDRWLELLTKWLASR